ncbi:MAG: nucleoside-triphosphatase [bacterium]
MQFIPHTPLNSVWLKAAVVGSLWASVEIIIGSFLHNLRIPFTGAILSFMGVWMLVASVQFWKESGLVWRAGVICALMKSISPSAMILGPMIGILTEAIILELILILFGRNILAYLVGGALAVFSTLVHKVVSLLILYGFDLIPILEGLYRFGVKQINLSQLSPVTVVIIIAAIYLTSGMTAAILGYRAGRHYLKHRLTGEQNHDFTLQPDNRLAGGEKKQKFSILFLVMNLAAVIGILLLINFDYLWAGIALSLLYFGFCVWRYKRAMRRFRNKLIWIQFVVVVLSASFLIGGLSSGNLFFSAGGLVTGLKMILRAAIVITGYAAISVELRNPLIRSIMVRRGFSNLYQSLGLAFSALPGIIATMPPPKELFRRSNLTFSGFFSQAEVILRLFETEDSVRPSIVIITGGIGKGKTTFAKHVTDYLRHNGYGISGFLAIGVQEEGKRTGFDLLDLRTNERVELCRETGTPENQRAGKYFFRPEGIKKGNELLDPLKNKDAALFVIDEIGPLELNGRGWSQAIETLCEKNDIPQLWIVREGLVDQAVRRWKTGDARIFDIGTDSVEVVTVAIRMEISDRSGRRNP